MKYYEHSDLVEAYLGVTDRENGTDRIGASNTGAMNIHFSASLLATIVYVSRKDE